MKRLITYFMVGMVSLMLTACGFHLRGVTADKLDIKDMAVSAGDKYGSFIKQLRERLEEAGVNIHDDAIYKLNVTESWDGRSLSYSNAIRGTEIERVLALHYQISGRNGLPLLESIVEARGVYIYDTNNIVANDRQQIEMQDKLRSEAIELLIDRLRVVSSAQLEQMQEKAQEQLTLRKEAETLRLKALKEREKSLLNVIPLEDIEKLNQHQD